MLAILTSSFFPQKVEHWNGQKVSPLGTSGEKRQDSQEERPLKTPIIKLTFTLISRKKFLSHEQLFLFAISIEIPRVCRFQQPFVFI
jgi:hypothetical protein